VPLTVTITKTEPSFVNIHLEAETPYAGEPFTSHPFSRVWRDAKLDMLEDGDDEEPEELQTIDEVIADNSFTQELLHYIQMPEEELSALSGHTSVDDYRAILIGMLAKLWD